VGYLLTKYRDEVTPSKSGADVETSRVNHMLNLEPGKTLCAVKLPEVQHPRIHSRRWASIIDGLLPGRGVKLVRPNT
jgi:hypothetical protein